MKTLAKSVMMLAVVAASVSFASCGTSAADKAKADSIAAAAKADSIAAAEEAAAAAAADSLAADSAAVAESVRATGSRSIVR